MRFAFVGIHVDAGKCLAGEFVGDHFAGSIDRRARAMDRSRRFRIPPGRLIAHVLQPNRPADGFSQQRGVHRRIAGIVATVGARARNPDGAHFLRRQAEYAGDAVTSEMRLLRTGPQRDLVVFNFHDSASGTHAGMGLKRPFVLGLDDTGGGFKRFIDIASLRVRAFLLTHRGLANVIVERSLIRKWRRRIRPRHLELLRGPDRVPFLVGDDAEKALVPHHARTGNVLDRTFVDADRHGARNRRTDHPAVHHARHFNVGAEIKLCEDARRAHLRV